MSFFYSSSHLEKALSLPEKLNPVDWVQKYVVMPQSVSKNRAGKIIVQNWMKPILMDLENSNIIYRSITSATRTGKSTLMLLCLLYNFFYLERASLIVLPDEESSERFFKGTLKKVIEASPYLSSQMSKGRYDNNQHEIFSNSGISIRCATAGSANALASTDNPCVILDEVDKFPRITGEADPISLAKSRVAAHIQTGCCVFAASTPTNSEGFITKLNNDAFLHEWNITCPNCLAQIPEHFDNIKFDLKMSIKDIEAHPESITWRCPNCKNQITEKEYKKLQRNGCWKLSPGQKLEEKSKLYIGYKLHGLLSDARNFETFVVQFKRIIDHDSEEMQDFKNSYLGECFEAKAIKYNHQDMLNLIDPDICEKDFTCPNNTLGILCACDVGGTIDNGMNLHYWLIVMAILTGNQNFVLCAKKFINNEDGYAFDNLKEFLLNTWKTVDGEKEFQPGYCLIDSGYEQMTIFNQCQNTVGFYPCKGSAERKSSPVTTSFINKDEISGSLMLTMIDTFVFKDELHMKITNKSIRFANGLDEDIFNHIVAEHKYIEKKKNGNVAKYRNKGGKPNHYLDAIVYAFALSFYLRWSKCNSQEEFDIENGEKEEPGYVAPIIK